MNTMPSIKMDATDGYGKATNSMKKVPITNHVCEVDAALVHMNSLFIYVLCPRNWNVLASTLLTTAHDRNVIFCSPLCTYEETQQTADPELQCRVQNLRWWWFCEIVSQLFDKKLSETTNQMPIVFVSHMWDEWYFLSRLASRISLLCRPFVPLFCHYLPFSIGELKWAKMWN